MESLYVSFHIRWRPNFLDLLAKYFILKASNFDILFYLEIPSTRCFLSVSNMLGALMKIKLTKLNIRGLAEHFSDIDQFYLQFKHPAPSCELF